MVSRLRGKLTYANVVATIALFIALGGGAYAAFKLPKNSVGAKQIKKNAVTGAKIKNGAVTATKLGPNSVGTASISDGAITSSKIAEGQVTARALAAPEAFRSAGLTPNPSFNCANAPNQWASSRPDVNGEVGYYRGLDGTVHLSGDAARCGSPYFGDVIFALPPGYAPASFQDQVVVNNGGFDELTIDQQGQVIDTPSSSGDIVSLDGVNFRCSPSGQNGCP